MMIDATERARKFFKLDRRISALEDFKPPRDDIIAAGLWTDVLVEYSRDTMIYSSLVDRRLAYRIPLTGLIMDPSMLNARICKRMKMLVAWGCIRKVVWVFHSWPCVSLESTTGPFLSLLVEGAIFGVKSVELHISDNSGRSLLDLLRLAPQLADVRLVFVLCGPLFCIPWEVLSLIEQRESWHRVLDLYIDVNQIAEEDWAHRKIKVLKPRFRDIEQIDKYLAPLEEI
ncbi:hypothetical protein TRVA0_009S01816 [Trichomonascus vanleenenianus]|uniref:uncharacterized protein n=1 Tax=Trichomonascus vanleenenianus TaxID=2268995 RepID=UPI003ECAEE8F